MIINEQLLLLHLVKAKKVVLLEALYERQYIPLGLAKLAKFLNIYDIPFVYQREYKDVEEDIVLCTSLFTYTSNDIVKELSKIDFAKKHVILGGISASLIPEFFMEKFPKLGIFPGYSKMLDSLGPLYEHDFAEIPEWKDWSFVFTSRGCPNNCGYCAVKTVEPEIWINDNWKHTINLSRKHIQIHDNNLSAMPLEHLKSVVNFLVEHYLTTIFDNGFDCKKIDNQKAKLLSKVIYNKNGLRLAFDRISENGIFQNAIKKLMACGISGEYIMIYVLFNFKDTVQEAIYRADQCVKLGITPYPQCYIDLKNTEKKFSTTGEFWTETLKFAFREFYKDPKLFKSISFENWLIAEKHLTGKDKDWLYYKKGEYK